MNRSFRDFISNIIVENLHPELQSIVTSTKSSDKAKQHLLATKIKDLSSRGEKTGIEGNMPKGSSRAYLKHEEHEPITVDGKQTTMPVGTKVAIKSQLDKYHKGDLRLGAMQNHAEAGDHWVNQHYRTLVHDDHGGFKTNHEGIFPPLVDHDHDHHEWSKVGHAANINDRDFQKLTKTTGFHNGITHEDFYHTLNRFHDRNNGKYWGGDKHHEARLNKIEEHPLVQKFLDYHGNTGHPPHDYMQIENLGKWKHPVTGKEHIVARDHGFDTEVQHAYSESRKRLAKGNRDDSYHTASDTGGEFSGSNF